MMTMNSDDIMVEDIENLRRAAMHGNWTEVLKMFEERKELRTAKIMVTGDTVLHMAVSSGKEHVVQSMVDLVCAQSINEQVGSSSSSAEAVNENGDEWKLVLGAETEQGNTPLHLAALMGRVKMCKKIGRINISLIVSRNKAGETPIFLAALCGMREAFLWLHYLYKGSSAVSPTDFDHCKRNNDDTILHCAIAHGHFDVAIEIVHLYEILLNEEMMMMRNKEGLSPLHLLAAKPLAFKSSGLHELPFPVRQIYKIHHFFEGGINRKNQATTLEEWEKIAENHERPQNIITVISEAMELLHYRDDSMRGPVAGWLYRMHKIMASQTWSLQIMKKLLKAASNEDMSRIISRTASEHLSIPLQTQDKENVLGSGTITIETPLMIAAKNGVVEMVEEIIERFPSSIKDVNAEGKNILLLAVEYRQRDVYRFLCKRKWLSESGLFEQVDKEGNNALHLAARLVRRNGLNYGEIKWFDFVKDSASHHGLSGRYNKKMETPEDIFRENPEELLKSQAKWVAQTSEACSLVSILVASVAFATRSTVPGDYDGNGYATLRNKKGAFEPFVNFEAIALVFSLISTVNFLSILAYPSFQSMHSFRSVYFKLQFGVTFMFYSIWFLWASFCAGHFFSLSNKNQKLGNALAFYIPLSLVIILFVGPLLPSFSYPILSNLMSIPVTRREATPPIQYRRTNNMESAPVLNRQN